MQRVLLSALFLAAVSISTVFAFKPDQLKSLTFDNATGATIEMIFLSPSDSKFWGPDIIGADYILKNGASQSYFVYCSGTSFTFDVLASDTNGKRLEVRNVEIPNGTDATVRLTAGKVTGKAPDLALVTVGIENRTSYEIEYLFVSPSDSQTWGVDLLDAETTLARGGTCTFVLLVGRERMKYNLMAVDENNDEYHFTLAIAPRAGKELTWAIEPGDLEKSR